MTSRLEQATPLQVRLAHGRFRPGQFWALVPIYLAKADYSPTIPFHRSFDLPVAGLMAEGVPINVSPSIIVLSAVDPSNSKRVWHAHCKITAPTGIRTRIFERNLSELSYY
jgi:hypothetical protein